MHVDGMKRNVVHSVEQISLVIRPLENTTNR